MPHFLFFCFKRIIVPMVIIPRFCTLNSYSFSNALIPKKPVLLKSKERYKKRVVRYLEKRMNVLMYMKKKRTMIKKK